MIVYDHPAWVALQAHVTRNLPEYITFVGALAIATVCTIPEKIPSSMQEMWSWMRSSLQTAVPAARAQHTVQMQSTVTPTETIKSLVTTSPEAAPVVPKGPNEETPVDPHV